MRKFLKWFLISFVILTVTIFVFMTYFLEGLLVDKLTRELNRTFHHYYSIDYKSMNAFIDWNGLSIQIDEPRFKSDTVRHQLNKRFPTLFFTSDKLELKGISVRKLLFTDDLRLDGVKLEKPTLKVIVYDADTFDLNGNRKKRRRKPFTDYLDISKAEIIDGTLACSHYRDLSDTTFLGYDIDASVENIDIKASRIKTLAYGLTKDNNLNFTVRKALWKPYLSNYFFAMDSLKLDDAKKIISAKNLAVKTFTSKLHVSRKFRYARDIPEATVGAFILQEYRLKELILQQSMVVRSITLDQSRVEIFKNRKKAINKQQQILLIHELLVGLPFSVKIDTLHVTHASLYFEMIHQKGAPLGVYLTNMDVLVTRINTLPGNRDTMILDGRAKFMGVASFRIRLLYPDIFKDNNYYKGYIGKMPFETLNTLLASYTDIKITEGKIHSIVFQGRCTKYENFGSLVFRYNDLRIERTRQIREDKKRKVPLVTLMGNVVLRNNNPRREGEEPERISYHIRREKYRGHVALLFGGILEGVKTTLMKKEMQEKVKKFRAKRSEKSKKKKLISRR